jgi:hypothetical protein
MQKFYIEKYKFPKNLKAYLENQNFSIKSKTYGKSKASQKYYRKLFRFPFQKKRKPTETNLKNR